MNDTADALIVAKTEEGARLDKFLALHFPEYSRAYFQYLIDEGLVLVNGSLVKKRTSLKEGDEIEVEFALTPEITLEPEPIPLAIIYEDQDLIAVNKPAGLVVHPAVGNWSGTFVNALLYHCKQLEKTDPLRPGIVHRLDKETSGVLLAAKNERTQKKLVAAFAQRQIEKEYFAICVSHPGSQIINAPIGRHPTRRKEMAIVASGKKAITRVETLSFNGTLSLVRLFPETGRTHQLRVHLKAIGCPVLGDSVYGNTTLNKKLKATRQLLHAYKLRFMHPSTKEILEITAALPDDMRSFIKLLGDIML